VNNQRVQEGIGHDRSSSCDAQPEDWKVGILRISSDCSSDLALF
jgi:hypothetical protein